MTSIYGNNGPSADPLGSGTYGAGLSQFMPSFGSSQQNKSMDWGSSVLAKPMTADWASGLTSNGGFSGAGLAPQQSQWDTFMGGLLGSTNPDGTKTNGWGGMALGAAQSLGNAFMGMQQYGLAKDSLAQSKEQFDMNWGAQKATTNSALEDRQRARVASNAGAYQSVSDYMNKNGIK